VAFSKEAGKHFKIEVEGIEGEPNVFIEATPPDRAVKLQAMCMHRSQEDSQEIADIFEELPRFKEQLYQVYLPVAEGQAFTGFWPEVEPYTKRARLLRAFSDVVTGSFWAAMASPNSVAKFSRSRPVTTACSCASDSATG
jgi:hypothetical protein